MGGAVSYLTHLLHELSRLEGNFQFIVFLPPETATKMEGLAPNIQLLPVAIGPAGVLRRLIWEQITLRRFLKRQRADVLFSTANFGMFRCPVRQLLLVRNALYFSDIYREMFLPRHSLRYRIAFALRRWLICQSARSADVVMTPTQAMLDELRGAVEVKEAVVNPYGVAAPERPAVAAGGARHPSEGAGNRVTRLLYVSLYGEHKNLATLLKALALLNARGDARFKLQTTADPAWPGAAWTVTYREDIILARRPGIAEHADFAGPLRREEVDRLYQASDICVFPSLTESFGFPMVEAMSHGLPILAADTPVNREVCGSAAIYFSPLSAGNLADRLLRLATDSALCSRLASRGRQEAARRFSWSAHVRRIVETACSHGPETIRSDRALPLTPGVLSHVMIYDTTVIPRADGFCRPEESASASPKSRFLARARNDGEWKEV